MLSEGGPCHAAASQDLQSKYRIQPKLFMVPDHHHLSTC